jgi:hypothetical protein
MAYSRYNSVANVNQAVSNIETFLNANGWTVVEISASPKSISASKNNGGETFFYEITSDGVNDILIRGTNTYPTPTESSTTVYINTSDGVLLSQHIFGGDMYCYIAIENTENYFAFGGFGRLIPIFGFGTLDLEGSFVLGSSDGVYSNLKTTHENNTVSGGPNFCWDSGFSANTVKNKNNTSTAWKGVWNLSFASAPGSVGFLHDISILQRFFSSLSGGSQYVDPNIVQNQPMIPCMAVVSSIPYGYYPDLCFKLNYRIDYGVDISVGSDLWFHCPWPQVNRYVTPLVSYGSQSEVGLFIKK